MDSVAVVLVVRAESLTEVGFFPGAGEEVPGDCASEREQRGGGRPQQETDADALADPEKRHWVADKAVRSQHNEAASGFQR